MPEVFNDSSTIKAKQQFVINMTNHFNFSEYLMVKDGITLSTYRGILFFQSGKCKLRFARTLSHLMETYYEKIQEYHNGDNPENGEEGGNNKDKCM